jgi:mRNA-degrading endonuclease toxin of MazEF toxin-antitoxin module
MRGVVAYCKTQHTNALRNVQITCTGGNSVVNCVNLLTLDKGKILRKLGSLPDALMQQVNNCLKAALELP